MRTEEEGEREGVEVGRRGSGWSGWGWVLIRAFRAERSLQSVLPRSAFSFRERTAG